MGVPCWCCLRRCDIEPDSKRAQQPTNRVEARLGEESAARAASRGRRYHCVDLIERPELAYASRVGDYIKDEEAANGEMNQRRSNERRYANWAELKDGGRRYWYDVPGRLGWMARYVKEVDSSEKTVRFHQEIYDEHGRLMEVHQKYPEDTGHQHVGEG